MQMKMRSDMTMMKRLLLSGAIFFLSFGNTLMLYARECSAVFENNKKKILDSKSFVVDGYIFATGKMLSRSSNREVGFSKAKLEAVSNIVYFLESKVDWPQKISPVLRKRVWDEYLKCVPVELSIQKSNIIYRNASGDQYTIVIAVSEKNVSIVSPAFSSIKETLLSPANYQSGKINISVCIELCNGNIPVSLQEAYANKLGKEYGKNVKQMLLSKNAYSFTCRKQTEIANKSIHDLLILLNTSPYDPELCYSIGEALEKDEFPRTAGIFFAQGSIAREYSSEYAKKCQKKINGITTKKMPVLPAMLFIASAGNANFSDSRLDFLNYYAGMLPVGVADKAEDNDFNIAQNAFARNQLKMAYDHYTKSVASKVTFEGCNMAGNAGRRIGNDHEAIALLLQATISDQRIVYPWVHLAWIYRKLNLKEQENFCIEKIKTYKLDDWSSKQLKLLEK